MDYNWIEPSRFPAPETAGRNGIVAVSADLNVAMLVDAYTHGIFPWPCEEESVLWASPAMRGVLFLEEFHIPRSFRSDMEKMDCEFRVNTAFDQVIDGCASSPRPGQDGTWITQKMLKAYKYFHRCGYAHSFETFSREGKLVGGMYGVSVGGIFCGESMFHTVTGASKFALVKAVEYLKKAGVVLLDTQMVTPTTELFGAREIPRAEYLKLLNQYGGGPLRL